MIQARHILAVQGKGQGLHEITSDVAAWLDGQAVQEGLLTLFIRHTSASLLIQENAERDVRSDLEAFMERLIPEDPGAYRHTAEGPDDMPAHIKSALTQSHLSIPVGSGRMLLGTWQGIYLFEHRRRAPRREVVLHLIGEV